MAESHGKPCGGRSIELVLEAGTRAFQNPGTVGAKPQDWKMGPLCPFCRRSI